MGEEKNKMAESVHSKITAVSWGFVSFTDNSLFGTSRVGHFFGVCVRVLVRGMRVFGFSCRHR